jgi:PKD repeat protein
LTKTIALTVTDTVGQTNSVSHTVTLTDAAPVAAFAATVSGYSVSVDASTSADDHGIASYSWVWGDGSPAGSGVTATHAYTTGIPPLTKTIALTVTDTVGQTNSVSHGVTLTDSPPVAAFSIAPPVGLAISVDASASTDDHGIVSYAWDWGDLSAAGSGVTATHTYAAGGTYTVTLTVTDTVGQTNSFSLPVTVSGGNPPVASFTAVAASGGKLTVDASASTGTGTLTYAWNFGDNIISTGVTHVHLYTTTNTYTITLTVTDSVGQASASKTLAVTNSGVPPFPYIIYGTTFASDGATPLPNTMVSLTNVRTGETLIGTISDVDGLYSADVSALYVATGDTIVATGLGPAGQTGTNSGLVDLGTPYLGIDLTLT